MAVVLAASDPTASAVAEKTRPVKGRDWVFRPAAEDAARYFPERAMRMDVNGVATVNCRVTAETLLEDCRLVSESPDGYRFGEAALKLVRMMRMKAPTPKEIRKGVVRREFAIGFQNPR